MPTSWEDFLRRNNIQLKLLQASHQNWQGWFSPTIWRVSSFGRIPPKKGASPSGGMIVQCDFPWSHGRSLIYSTSKNQMRVFGGRRKLSLSIFKGAPYPSWLSTWTHLSPLFGSLPSCFLGWISCLEGESLWNSKANLVFRGTPYGVNTPSPNKYLRPIVSILQGELVNESTCPYHHSK
jgi:hypothetical protein